MVMMISPRFLKWVKITYSIIIRLFQLGWLGGFGLAVGIFIVKQRILFGVFPIILYLLNILGNFYILIISPIFGFHTSILFIFLFDLISILGNISFYISTKFIFTFIDFIGLSIPGIMFHLASLIPFIIWSLLPLRKIDDNGSVFLMKERFLYGCIFLKFDDDNDNDQSTEEDVDMDITMFDVVTRDNNNRYQESKNPFCDPEIMNQRCSNQEFVNKV